MTSINKQAGLASLVLLLVACTPAEVEVTKTTSDDAFPSTPVAATPQPTMTRQPSITPKAAASPPPNMSPSPSPTPTPIFYTQERSLPGAQIRAPSSVDARALDRASEIVTEMLVAARPDIAIRLAGRGASLVIIPRDEYITILPEFAYLSGQVDPNGNSYDSFTVRGAGGILSQTATATSEENLLRLPSDPFWNESITHHEFAHAIMNLGFDARDISRWSGIYQIALSNQTFPGAFAMSNQDEYWAELSQSYFDVNNEIGGPLQLSTRDPEAFTFIQEIYGER